MIYIMAANDLSNSSYYGENDNFQVSILEEMFNMPTKVPNLKISTYYSISDNVEEYKQDYEDDPGNDEFEFIQTPYLYNSIESMINKISTFYNTYMKDKVDEDYKDLMVMICIPGSLGRSIKKDINKILKSKHIDVEVMSLYELYGVTTQEEMNRIIKNKLSTDFIYDTDPIIFSYAVYKSLNIGSAK